VRAGRLAVPEYDFVFVDEAQFFAPTWFHLIKGCVRPGSGQLFLAADPTQGFLKRRQSWLASGLDVRGYSARLLRCYRNTREILAFAIAFYRSRMPDEEEEEINLPGPGELALLPSGPAPQFLYVDSSQTELARVAHEIASALRAGANPEHFLVLQSDAGLVAPFIQILSELVGRPVARDLRTASYCAETVRVSSLNAATGLECPVVFFCGLDGLLEKEGPQETDERSELVRDNTRRVYMGLTRASQKLVITHRRPSTRRCLEAGGRLMD
jgi:superfamily I DNA/RNA helicase